jgi:hypothetical protein
MENKTPISEYEFVDLAQTLYIQLLKSDWWLRLPDNEYQEEALFMKAKSCLMAAEVFVKAVEQNEFIKSLKND